MPPITRCTTGHHQQVSPTDIAPLSPERELRGQRLVDMALRDSHETASGDDLQTQDSGGAYQSARHAMDSNHLSPAAQRFNALAMSTPADVEATRAQFMNMSLADRSAALARLITNEPQAAATMGQAFAARPQTGAQDAQAFWYSAHVALETAIGSRTGAATIEPLIDELALLSGPGAETMRQRAEVSLDSLSQNAFFLRPRSPIDAPGTASRKALEFSTALNGYKAAVGGDHDAKMLALARRRPVEFAHSVSGLTTTAPRLYQHYRDAALDQLTPSQLGSFTAALAKDFSPKVTRMKADLANELVSRARKAPLGPLPQSHHSAGYHGATQQQLSSAAVSLLRDPAVSRYSGDHYQQDFQKNVSFLIATNRPEAERWITGMIEHSARDYAAALDSGDMRAARDAARQIGITIGEAEQAIAGTISDPKEAASMMFNIIEGTTKILGVAFPGQKAALAAFETGLKYGKAAFKPGWSKAQALQHFATQMFEATMIAYEGTVDPTGTKRETHDPAYGRATRAFLDDIVGVYNDHGGDSNIDINIFQP